MGHIKLIPATLDDSADLFAWRNDPDTILFSKVSKPVDWNSHMQWLASTLARTDRKVYVGFSQDLKIGTVRFDGLAPDLSRMLVSITVAPSERGKGFGKRLLAEAAALFPEATLEAEILSDNGASQAIFAVCGFVKIVACPGGLERYERTPAPRGLTV